MIYLERFKFTPYEIDADITFSEIYETKYPFGILSKHKIECVDFMPITIFYGGNGSGKTTALNIIAEKLKITRNSLFNKGAFFDKYLSFCKYNGIDIPPNSQIITSDDVFEFTMNLRHLNQGIDNKRNDLIKEYSALQYKENRLTSLEDYERFNKLLRAQNESKRSFVRRNLAENLREHSNGESALIYFTQKINENALYLLDEPENSLSPNKQQELLQFIVDSVRFYNCQFIIATHSPFLLSLKDALIYDFDENPFCTKKWTELKNVRDYYNFFKKYEKDFATDIKPRPKVKQDNNSSMKKRDKRESYSELGKQVYDRLKEIWDYEDFYVGSMAYLDTEEKLQKMLDFLKKTGTTDSDDVIPYSIKIAKGLV